MRIKEILLQGSERFPVIVGNDDMPMLYPNLYLLTMSRKRDALNTMKAKCRTVMHLYSWCELNNIVIESRFKDGQLFNAQEIESLCASLSEEYSFANDKEDRNEKIRISTTNIIELNFKLPKNLKKYVHNNTYNNRLIYVCRYMEWLIDHLMSGVSRETGVYARTMLDREKMIKDLNNSKFHSRNDSQIKGLSSGVQEILYNVIDSQNESNPFVYDFVKLRNHLFVYLSLATGMRRGEMLKLKNSHFNVATKGLTVERNPDDPDDKRSTEPNVKTNSRILKINPDICKLLIKYLQQRSNLKKARAHPFLFVSRTGSPLSYSSVGSLYAKLKKKVPELFDEKLSQHVLRHQWNKNFSEEMKLKKLPDEQIDTFRKVLMGWSATSLMPERYNKEFITEQANELSVLMQDKVFNVVKDSNIKNDKSSK